MTTSNQEPLTFMAVHAHPDDEVFGTGGTFARLSGEGVRTVLVTCTRGENGEIVDPEMDEATKQATFPRLGEVREVELQASVAALGVSELRFLGFRDSGMAGTPENQHPDSFHRALFDEAVKRLVGLIREFKPQVITTYDPFGGYGHPDHVQAYRVATVAFEVAGDARFYSELGLPVWEPQKLYHTAFSRSNFRRLSAQMKAEGVNGPWNNPEMETDNWGMPDEVLTTRIDIRDYIPAKLAAFRAHKTQISPDNFMMVIPDKLRREALGDEWFIRVRDRSGSQPEGLEEDLFAGLR